MCLGCVCDLMCKLISLAISIVFVVAVILLILWGVGVIFSGGVLSYTRSVRRGVENNKTTNETRYLILDPHYTGAENICTVVGKGWCGWKSTDYWNKTAHYKFCSPQTKPSLWN